MTDLSSHAALQEALRNGALLPTPQASALLQELLAMLKNLSEHRESSSIDIRSLPLTPADYDFLNVFLGDGEVSAKVNALGLSEIKETRFSGIWWIRHFNSQDELIAELIEVTNLPDILKTQMPDLYQSLDALRRYIEKLEIQH